VLPLPRLLGRSKDPIRRWDISKIRIYPEERSHRIDVCWEKEKPGRWIGVNNEFLNRPEFRAGYSSIWITRDKSLSLECPNYDVIVWRGWCLILASSIIPELLDTLGMTERFGRWLSVLLHLGEIPIEDRPLLKEHLSAAKGSEGEALLPQMVLPFERRFGDQSRRGRDRGGPGERL